MMTLASNDLTRLARLCAMFSSTFDGERANAAALADKMVKAAGMTWEQLLCPVSTPEPVDDMQDDTDGRMWREPQTEREIPFALLFWPEVLTPWENDFLRSVAGKGRFSEKQLKILNRILDKVRPFALREATVQHD